MTFGIEHIGVALGAILTTFILNNTKLKEGATEWFVNRIGSGKFDATDHTVFETIKGLVYEASIQEFDNELKEMLYKYYMETVLLNFKDFADNYAIISKTKKINELKKETKILLYNTLHLTKTKIDTTIKMPDVLQSKFDTFRNYLDKQHIYVMEKAINANTKTILNIQLLDALENNIRWMFFYTTDMFEGFNGRFDSLSKNDIFLNI